MTSKTAERMKNGGKKDVGGGCVEEQCGVCVGMWGFGGIGEREWELGGGGKNASKT